MSWKLFYIILITPVKLKEDYILRDKAKSLRRKVLEQRLADKRFQRGVEFPKAGVQKHLLIVRLDLAPQEENNLLNPVKAGLKRLCTLFDRLDSGEKAIDQLDENGIIHSVKISDPKTFNFSSTIGFGIGFFDKLDIREKRPSRLKGMPDHSGLGDVTPYSLSQTDLVIQLGSNSDFVNRWVFQNVFEPVLEDDRNQARKEQSPQDIVTAVRGWATVTDVHSGFQRIDGRNLMGFNDGISNPNPGSGKEGFDQFVWTVEQDEGPVLKDSTYMVFQKISHDLDQWQELDVGEQEEWVGRDKVTGLLLGTAENTDEFKDKILKNDVNARKKLADLIEKQSDPTIRFYDKQNFRDSVAAWSHVRKANPREEGFDDRGRRLPRKIIFRRGYPFIQTGLNNKTISGLLFVSFQKDIEGTFEYIKKNFFGSKIFPTPKYRKFTRHEINKRKSQGRYSSEELKAILSDPTQKILLGLGDIDILNDKRHESADPDAQNTGREGLAGPSELGVNPTGEFIAIVPFGGGYYFIPPIPNRRIADIGQQFF
jgi:Dyp-type peroxidase family